MPTPLRFAPAHPPPRIPPQGPVGREARLDTPGSRRSASRVLRLGWVALACTLSACDGGPTGPVLEGEVAAFVEGLNDYRTSVGCAPLEWNAQVAEVAEAHSQDMLDRSFFAHTNPDGVTASGRLQEAGISYRSMAENIAWGYPTGASVLEGWLGSSGHRANIENCALEQHGVGLVGTHWTHVFMTP